MESLVIAENDDMLEKILSPMMYILDEKNITKGITTLKENGKVYICFDKKYLSKTNELILEKISYVYNKTFFHSNNELSPNLDRLEYWCPDKYYDEMTHITESCHNKKMVVLELELNDQLSILGTSIMVADILQEQDPMSLEVNEEEVVLDEDVIKRHEHYVTSGHPDLAWINLFISLDKDNPLRQNPYAPRINMSEINSPVSCDNPILATVVGCDEKKYIYFSMGKEDFEKAINEYFERSVNIKEQNDNIILSEARTKLLKS